MNFQALNVDWAALEARVLAKVTPNDSIQLDPSAVIPTDFASLPECEVEDDACPKYRSDMYDAAAWSRLGRGPISGRTSANTQRHEWLREYATTYDSRTGEDMARRPSSER